jgi:hypothetical protein
MVSSVWASSSERDIWTVWKWLFKPVLGAFALFGFLGVLAHYVTSGPRRTQPEPPAKDDADANINV